MVSFATWNKIFEKFTSAYFYKIALEIIWLLDDIQVKNFFSNICTQFQLSALFGINWRWSFCIYIITSETKLFILCLFLIKIDIKCVEPSTGVNYYKDHLPKLGEWKHKLRAKETGANAMVTRSSRCENPKGNEPGVGDSVCVSLAPDIVKAMNSDIKEWRDEDNKVGSITNGNWTEWSPIWSVIIRVITKSDDRVAGVRFSLVISPMRDITSVIAFLTNCHVPCIVIGCRHNERCSHNERIYKGYQGCRSNFGFCVPFGH